LDLTINTEAVSGQQKLTKKLNKTLRNNSDYLNKLYRLFQSENYSSLGNQEFNQLETEFIELKNNSIRASILTECLSIMSMYPELIKNSNFDNDFLRYCNEITQNIAYESSS